MSSSSSKELINSLPNRGDNGKVQIVPNTKILIENHSGDITISKCDQIAATKEMANSSGQGTAVSLKAQVLPLVYVKNKNIPFGGVKTNSNNFILSQITTGCYVNKTTSNKNVILAPARGPLVLPKPSLAIVPGGAKVASTYVTMLKQVPKPSEFLTDAKITEAVMMAQNGFIQTGTNTQKILLAPMPKIQSNRPPTTVTTNSVQSKITVLPMPVPKTDSETCTVPKLYNIQLSENQYSNLSSSLTLRCDSSNNVVDKKIGDFDCDRLVCNETLDVSPEKNDVSEKAYELSIAEESLSNQSEGKLIVSSVDNSNSSNDNVGVVSINKLPNKFSHGVSILKKSVSSNIFHDIKKSETENGVPKQIGYVEAATSTPKPSGPKPEQRSRRKSQFNFRKDFDDVEISFLDAGQEAKQEPGPAKIMQIKEEVKCEDVDMVQELDARSIFNLSYGEVDVAKLLSWDKGIGSLPGSSLKFIVNEFGIVEFLLEGEFQVIMDDRAKKSKEREDMEQEVHCLECGCYGIRSDFVTSQFCSVDCQENCASPAAKKTADAASKKGIKRKLTKSKSENDIKEESFDDDDSNDNNAQDKFAYPWACKKKGFSWSKYLAHVNAKAAPMKLFKDPFPYTRNAFKPGMKVEGVDPQHPSYFCVLTVVDTVGYRLRLHFDGYSDNYDFWVNADTMDIFPMGWCEKYGHVLHPPPSYKEDSFSWVQYLRTTKSTAAPKHLFANRAGQAICPNGFRIGMKLEAVDKKNTSLVCVATVRDMMDNRLLVHFDGWDDIYDYWADPTSPYIHPVGWCDQYGHNLTPPSDYPTPENFTWEKYLKEKKAVAAPVRAFKQRPACGFKRGMRLECVDRRVPHLIRAATIDDVKEHQIRIHFDGWPDRYCYWVDDDSPDIHPIGWCQKTGHPMEPPLTPDDVYDFLECPTVGCRGEGHIMGLKFTTHSTQKFCPYAEENIDIERVVPDRLLSPDKSPEAIVPVSREPKDYKHKPRVGRPPKWLKELEATTKTESVDEAPEKKPKKRHSPHKIKKELDDVDMKDSDLVAMKQKVEKLIEESKIPPAERESWAAHSRFLCGYIPPEDDPTEWSVSDVVDFVSSVPGCDAHAVRFLQHQIDGEALLHLSQRDFVQLLHIKVGPAVKLYNCVVLLRGRCFKTK